jgi:hypothetical protein
MTCKVDVASTAVQLMTCDDMYNGSEQWCMFTIDGTMDCTKDVENGCL